MQQQSLPSGNHTTFDGRARLRAASIHLVLSVLVAVLTALLVFELWYPYPYREISGGRELFQLVVSVDIVLGPLLTFAVFNRAKPRAELKRDLAVVVALQLAGLAYGLWTVHLARPVHMVFEYDRFRVVHQVDIPPELASRVPAGMQLAPPGGPTVIALRPFRNAREDSDFTMAALNGLPLAARTELWEPYGVARGEVLKAARPVIQLEQRFPQRAAEIEAVLRRTGHDAAHAAYLPLVARSARAWTVLLDAGTADPIGYLPLDSF